MNFVFSFFCDRVFPSFNLPVICTCSVPLQEIPSYNDKRRRQSLLVESQTSLLQRSHSNPHIYYGRPKAWNCVNGGSATLSAAGLQQRRYETSVRDMYKRLSCDMGQQHFDVDSLQSVSVSSCSSLSGNDNDSDVYFMLVNCNSRTR